MAGGNTEPIGGLAVNRWRRYGRDRLYVNARETGEALGYLDVQSDEVVVFDERDRRIVEMKLKAERSG